MYSTRDGSFRVNNTISGWLRLLLIETFLAALGLRHFLVRHFWWLELKRRFFYLPCNPWVISRRFLDQRGETEAQGYGQTPLLTLASVARHLQLTPEDQILELGAATGRNCLWLASRYGCAAEGVEQIPAFMTIANRVIKNHPLAQRVRFHCQDMFTIDMSHWTVVYVDCTAMSENCIQQVAKLCARVPPGTRIVTVNAGLERRMPELFDTNACFPGLFAWGWSDMRIQTRSATTYRDTRNHKPPLYQNHKNRQNPL